MPEAELRAVDALSDVRLRGFFGSEGGFGLLD
jgi:hypothetical protein